MPEILFNRKGHLIVNASNGEIVYEGKCPLTGKPSINAAKRESRRLQDQHHRFCVKRVDKLIIMGDRS